MFNYHVKYTLCSQCKPSTHCVDNINQVHIKDEDGIEEEHCLDVHEEELSMEEGEEDNLEGTKLALETKAYLDARKRNIEHLQVVV